MPFSDAGCPGRGTDLEGTTHVSIGHGGIELPLRYLKEEIARGHSDI